MSLSDIELREGAFLISDAHYSHLRPELLALFQEIDSQKLNPTQIILMGDIFDALFGEVSYTHARNKNLINIINTVAKRIEIIYLEGNHDFNLKKIFPQVKIFPLAEQPLVSIYKSEKVLLAHGDFNGTKEYLIYTNIIRNKIVLSILAFFDKISNHAILKKLDRYLSTKDDCKEIRNFKKLIDERINKNYNSDYFIEGHFHQNKKYNYENMTYFNIAAFACNQRYFIVKSLNNKELLEENIFSKGI